MKRNVVWSVEARKQLESAYIFIRRDSPASAQKVLDDIVAITRKLPANPESYPLDKYKLNNDGSYRAFEKHKYRIVYRIREHEIRILRVRHTKMNPLQY